MPQGTILGPLLFILYINDLKNVSNALDLIAFADDTILFISDKNINTLFIKANLELQKMNESKQIVTQHKISGFSLCHESTQKDNLPSNLALPILKIDAVELKKKVSTKFLGVLLDESL